MTTTRLAHPEPLAFRGLCYGLACREPENGGMMTDKYILAGHDAVPCDDTFRWGAWFENADRRVARTERGDVAVSTVFLGLDHSYTGEVGPILFETLVFGGDHDQDMVRYSTWEEAEAGHAAMCKRVFSE